MTKNKKEQDIQKEILDYLYSIGFLGIKHNNMGIYAKAGVPDILCCSNKGIFIGIEVKKPGEKPKPIQQAFLDAINRINGIGFSAVNVDEVKTEFKKRGIL